MKAQSDTSSSPILYSCTSREQRAVEQFVEFHSLIYVESGDIQFKSVEGVQTFGAGSFVLIKRNQLVKTIKTPPSGGSFESVSIFFEQELLRRYSIQRGIFSTKPYQGPNRIELPTNIFLTSFFESIKPYLHHPAPTNSILTNLKCQEALELILSIQLDLTGLLLDFSDPYKVDLEAFMVQHFMFNVSIDAFARMTGRSRAGFKRDFEKVFRSTPGQWLKQKRLEEAHHLIQNKKMNPSMVYLEVGFENLSHFSYAFKQQFGVAPSTLLTGQ
ncbi:AraC-like DNA-binding protein [Spirosoma oryzae]|uniref:AraC-like DNA-binding protein n=2 Tax=Spirosoma oryzae TaxID=1469603 RepID=A0A2T0SAH9_9BACT|nr:AraC-like DNA-binding protein [Spirosoma oryzae]